MNFSLPHAFLFFLGSVLGWVLDLFFCRFLSHNNPQRKLLNLGFCVGPYLSLYETGLCLLYLITLLLYRQQIIPDLFGNRVLLFLLMAFGMTAIEYLPENFLLNFFYIHLWDYSNEWANIQSIICPKLSHFGNFRGGLFLCTPSVYSYRTAVAKQLSGLFFFHRSVFRRMGSGYHPFGAIAPQTANPCSGGSRLEKQSPLTFPLLRVKLPLV